eukprot:SAG31_NODE_828_length_11716_cov_4.405785_5_plen_144_part_00
MHHMFAEYGAESALQRSTLSSVCHRSGEQIKIVLESGRVVETSHPAYTVCFTAPARSWYNDLVTTCHDHLLLFAGAEQLELWRREGNCDPANQFVLDESQVMALSRLFYGGRASPHFERRSLDEVLRVFQANGLVGEFWELPT